MQILRSDPHHPLRKRLWQAGVALALVIAVLLGHEMVVRGADRSRTLSLGEDFLPVYAAGILVREGRSRRLYDIEPLAEIERRVVRDADLEGLPVYGPFLNPPFFAAAYVPLSTIPYRAALLAWFAINLCLLCGSVILLIRLFPREAGWRERALVPLLIVLPLPFWMAMRYQQNTFLSLFLLSIVVTLWRKPARGWTAFFAGAVGGCLFYKPQLAAVVALALVLTRGRTALLGLFTTGTILLLATVTLMPGTLTSFARHLPPTVRWVQTAFVYNWGLQATPQSFWRLLSQGRSAGPTATPARLLAGMTLLAGAAALALAVVHFHRGPKRGAELDRLIAATICAVPLLMPYYMTYDLLLLSIAAVLFACDGSRHPRSRRDRVLVGAWVALYLELYFNPGLANHTRLNLAVPLIGAVAGLSLARCFPRRVEATCAGGYDAPRLAAAA